MTPSSSSPKKTTLRNDTGRFTPYPASDPSCPRRQFAAEICGRTKYFKTAAGRDLAIEREKNRIAKKEEQLQKIRRATERALYPGKRLKEDYAQRQLRFKTSRPLNEGERALLKILAPIKQGRRREDLPTGHPKLFCMVVNYLRDTLGTDLEENGVRAFRLTVSQTGPKAKRMYYQPCQKFAQAILDALLAHQSTLPINSWPRQCFNRDYWPLVKFLKAEVKRQQEQGA